MSGEVIRVTSLKINTFNNQYDYSFEPVVVPTQIVLENAYEEAMVKGKYSAELLAEIVDFRDMFQERKDELLARAVRLTALMDTIDDENNAQSFC